MPETTPIYAHVAGDGLPFCSYGVDYVYIEDLATPEGTVFSPLNYVEKQVFYERGDAVIEAITPEPLRDHEPLRVGTLTFDRECIVEVDLLDL